MRFFVLAYFLASPGQLMGPVSTTDSGPPAPTYAITTEANVKITTEVGVVLRTEMP